MRTAPDTIIGSQQGFTLIEVLVAAFLLLVAVMGTAMVTSTVINGNTFSKRMTTATAYAEDKLEELKTTAYGSLVSGSDTQESLYTRTWTVTGNSPATNMKTIQVSVSFSWKSQTHTVTMKTIAAEF